MIGFEENTPEDDSLDALIGAWQAGEIAPSQWESLCKQLRTDRDARARFLQHMQLDAELIWKFSEGSRAKAVLTEAFPQSEVPASLSELAEGSYSRDPYYQEILELVSGHEAIDLLWTQVYPQLRSYVAICAPRLADIDAITAAVIEDVANGYRGSMGPAEFFELVRESSRQATRQFLAAEKDATLHLEELFAASCFGGSAGNEGSSPSELYERLSEYVPVKMSEEPLKLLCLRYLHELSPGKIAGRLSLTTDRVQLDLAKARLSIWRHCCEPRFNGASQSEVEHLLMVSFLIDRRGLNKNAFEKLQAWLKSSDRNRRMLNTFAMLHECVYRQLSVDRLLDSLALSDSKSLRQVVGQAIQQIELFAEKSTPLEVGVRAKADHRNRFPAWAMAVAAVLLVGVGFLLQGGDQQRFGEAEKREAEKVAKSEPVRPKPIRKEVAPPPPPVVATLDELIDTGEGFAYEAGTQFRQGASFVLPGGIAQFSSANGSVLVVEGPAEVRFSGSDEIGLSQGKVVGLNSTKIQQIIVRTPSAVVRDLGTEFGVEVLPDGATSTAVYQGVVEVSGTNAGDLQTPLYEGWQSSIDAGAVVLNEAKPLLHDRAFVRPDEVRLRVAVTRGSDAARAEVAFYELMRVEGILAYEGFDGLQEAERRTIGIDPLRLTTSQGLQHGPNLSQGTPLSEKSKSIVAADGQQCFVHLDTSENSWLVRAGLVSPGGMVGDLPGEIWLSWKSKLNGTQEGRADWAGLSLMCGDRRQSDEPLFIGAPSNQTAYGIQFFEGPVRETQHQDQLDIDAKADGVQSMAVDDRVALWIAQLVMGPAGAEVRVWCNVPPDRIANTPPHLTQPIENLRFDRFRVELADARKQTTCAFDDILMATSSEALGNAIEIVGSSRE
jgi:hypothetical protein